MEAESLSLDGPAPMVSPSPPPLVHPPKEYKPKSNTFPALNSNPNVWAFIQQITDKIKKTKWKGLSDSNLTSRQKEVLISLQSNKSLIVKPSDKGGNLVVMDSHQYESMVMRLLQNRDWYKKIPDSLVQYTTARYQQLIGSAGPLNPPGRPIVTGNGCLTKKGESNGR